MKFLIFPSATKLLTSGLLIKHDENMHAERSRNALEKPLQHLYGEQASHSQVPQHHQTGMAGKTQRQCT